MGKKRADLLLVEKGLAESRQKAKALINAGQVFTPHFRVEKPSQKLREDEELIVKQPPKYVSRGGLKLEKALKEFSLSPEGLVCWDIGASTGGFTHCLLEHGAAKVYAIDVDPRQLHWKLLQRKEVRPVKLNARYIRKDTIPELPHLITVDVSFISALKILKPLSEFLPDIPVLVLVKPQFEAGRERVGRKGVIRDPGVIIEVVAEFCRKAMTLGFFPKGISLPIRGKEGNQEVFVLFRRTPPAVDVEKILKESFNEGRDSGQGPR